MGDIGRDAHRLIVGFGGYVEVGSGFGQRFPISVGRFSFLCADSDPGTVAVKVEFLVFSIPDCFLNGAEAVFGV